jgi:hypothetical protein
MESCCYPVSTHNTHSGANGPEDSSAIFCHVCLLISVDIVGKIGSEILCIKMNSFWANLNQNKIGQRSENGQPLCRTADDSLGLSSRTNSFQELDMRMLDEKRKPRIVSMDFPVRLGELFECERERTEQVVHSADDSIGCGAQMLSCYRQMGLSGVDSRTDPVKRGLLKCVGNKSIRLSGKTFASQGSREDLLARSMALRPSVTVHEAQRTSSAPANSLRCMHVNISMVFRR